MNSDGFYLMVIGFVLACMVLVVAIGISKMDDIRVINVNDPSVICQEDEAWWWVAPDTKGCVHYETICE